MLSISGTTHGRKHCSRDSNLGGEVWTTEQSQFYGHGQRCQYCKGSERNIGLETFWVHSLNLVVQNALQIIKPQINKVKRIVAHVKKSTVSSERLQRYQVQQGRDPKRLVQAVETKLEFDIFHVEENCRAGRGRTINFRIC